MPIRDLATFTGATFGPALLLIWPIAADATSVSLVYVLTAIENVQSEG